MKLNKDEKILRLYALILVVVTVAAATIMSAVAFFTDKDIAHNKFSVGENDISIAESFSTPDSINPGDTITKIPVVKVSGTDCYVRVFCEFSDSDVNYATLNFNTTDWTTKQSDGYYYYKHRLSDGEETKPLFTQVKIDDTVTNNDIDDFDIIIYSESAQAYDTYKQREFSNYQEAWEF